MNIIVTITDGQFAALEDIAIDPVDWLNQVALNRASAAVLERRTDPNWSQVLVSFAQAGGDINDDAAILAHGVQMGLFKTAAQRQAELDAAATVSS